MTTEENAKTVVIHTNTDPNKNAQQRSGNKQNINRNNRRGLTNNRNSVQLTNHITWEGDTSEVNCVVRLKIEKFHLKFSFERFKDNVMNYIVFNYKMEET